MASETQVRSRATGGTTVATIRKRSAQKWTEIVLFLTPGLIVYSLLVIVPIALAMYYSGFQWDGLGPLTNFVGVKNFQVALADPFFLGAIRNNFFVIIMSLCVQLPIALGLAIALTRSFPGRRTLRLIFFMPYVISEAITAVIWYLLLQPSGMVDELVKATPLAPLDQLWLADPAIVMFTLFVIISWKYFGFSMVLYLAGLSQIPKEIQEAASIDGANSLQQLRYITVPLLGPTIRVTAFLSIIGSLQLFDIPWIMTGGGPFHASETMATYMVGYGWTRTSIGYGSAVAVILFVIALFMSLLYQRFVLRRDIEGGLTGFAG